jgi:DNA repair protein RecO (recombination protein O)
VTLTSDDALILAVSDYSETSQIVTLFTEHNGKLRALAKGSKRPKSPFGGPLDRLQLVQTVFSVRSHGGLGLLTELAQRETFPGLRTNLRNFYAASYAAELAIAATPDLDPQPELFKILADTLRRLSSTPDSDILLFRFEVRLLGLLGLRPQLDQCVVCHRSRAAGRGGFFSPAASGLLCRQCAQQPQDAPGRQPSAFRVAGKALDALLFLAAVGDDELGRVRLASATAADMRRLLGAHWQYVLDRPLRAARWVS